jgi:hypothetical protein
MAITIDWATKVINIPQNYLANLGGGIYELNVNTFRLDLRDIEDNEDGIPFQYTHNHNTQVTLGGLTLSRVVEIIAPYFIEFQDGQYAVNLVGANNNIADRLVVNQVSVRSNNSAGMVTVTSNSGSGLSQAEHDHLMKKVLTVGKFLGLK